MSQSVSQSVSDKHCQWSDSGPIKNENKQKSKILSGKPSLNSRHLLLRFFYPVQELFLQQCFVLPSHPQVWVNVQDHFGLVRDQRRNTLQYGLTLIEPIWGRYLFIGTLATIPADRADSGSSFMAGISKGNYSLPTTLPRTVYLLGRGANLDANGQQMQTCKTVKCFVASLPLLVVELNATLSMDMTFTIDTCSFF